jgi:flagellar basal body-associated protein FliL
VITLLILVVLGALGVMVYVALSSARRTRTHRDADPWKPPKGLKRN